MSDLKISGNIEQYLTFRLMDEIYAINVAKVREILDKTDVTRVPRTPEFMTGVINLRGSVVPVISLRLKFGMEKGNITRDTCIIVLEVAYGEDSLIVGALADSVLEVIDMNDNDIEPPPSIGTKLDIEFIQGMGKHNDQFLMVLDIDKIFSQKEMGTLGAVAKEEEEAAEEAFAEGP